MLLGLFESLRAAKLPITLREWLDLLGTLDAELVVADPERLHLLARTVLIKDERLYDRFDVAFGTWIGTLERLDAEALTAIPDDWLRQSLQRLLDAAERAELQALGGLDELLAQFRQRLAEQRERHAGGNRWIGTGGSSPFGAGGVNPLGIRVGPRGGGRSAAKVWQQRAFRNYADDAELSPRNLQVALRRLRRFARTGAPEELDLDATIDATAREAGLLDLRLRPERHNAVKLLLFLDVGGSMDEHVQAAEALFAACRSEFRRLEHFYFHNAVYDHVWRDNARRFSERTPTLELLRRYTPDHRIVLVGDAAMAPSEVDAVGGSIEGWNEEPAALWLTRLRERYRRLVWINPLPPRQWPYTQSTARIRELVGGQMFALTPQGLTEAMRVLAR